MAAVPYGLEDAELDIATLRGQVDRLSEVLTKNDSTDPPTNPAAGLIHYSLGGQHKYASSDGGDYNTGWARARTTSDQTVNFTTDQVITGTVALSLPVAIGEYRVTGIIYMTQGGGSVAQAVGLTGPSTSHVRIGSELFANGGGAYSSGAQIFSTLSGGQLTQAMTTTSANFWWFTGWAVFTAAGTLSVVGHCNTTNTWTAGAYSFIEISPYT